MGAYYKNGQAKYEGSFARGKQDGLWKFYSESGECTRTVLLRNGKVIEDSDTTRPPMAESGTLTEGDTGAESGTVELPKT